MVTVVITIVTCVYVGECAVCRETNVQKCQCGRHSEVRPCGGAAWQCTEVIPTGALLVHHFPSKKRYDPLLFLQYLYIL